MTARLGTRDALRHRTFHYWAHAFSEKICWTWSFELMSLVKVGGYLGG
jgi:hypothetical protein